jgi:hypothetical protein
MSDERTARDKYFFGLLNLIFIPAAGIFFYLWLHQVCPACDGELVKIRHDTIHPADVLKPIAVKVPVPAKVISLGLMHAAHTGIKSFSQAVRFSADSTGVRAGAPAFLPVNLSPCDSNQYFYSDTIYQKDNYHLVINDTCKGKILGRSIWFVNLKPAITTTIEKLHKDRVKFYIGASVCVHVNYLNRWGAGPSALLSIPKIGAISYAYDVHNNAHVAGLYALIRLRK